MDLGQRQSAGVARRGSTSDGKEGEIDLPQVTNELTVSIASRCLLGAEIRASLETDFAPLYHDLQGRHQYPGFLSPKATDRSAPAA